MKDNPEPVENLELKRLLEIKWKTLFNDTFEYWLPSIPSENQEVFPCYACRNMFHLKSSIIDHVNRRGIKLSYNCTTCASYEPMIFYNPCALLLHARTHFTRTSSDIDLENITISMLPFHLMGFFPKVRIPMIYDEDEDNIVQTSSLSTVFYSASVYTMGQRIVTLQPNLFLYDAPTFQNPKAQLTLKQVSSNIPHCKFVLQSQPVSSKIISLNQTEVNQSNETHPEQLQSMYTNCLDCSRSVLADKRAQHYLGDNKLSSSYICDKCNHIACTPCQLKAHNRIHTIAAPYTCPECGDVFANHIILNTHLNEKCFHFIKVIRYKCNVTCCTKTFSSPQSFQQHFVRHITDIASCNKCDKKIDGNDFEKHNKFVHKGTACGVRSFNCMGCKKTPKPFSTNDVSEVEKHVQEHSSNQRYYVYRCACSKQFKTCRNYYEHIQKCPPHTNVKPVRRCKFCKTLSTTKEEADKHLESCIKRIKVRCVLCREKVRLLQVKHHMGADNFKSSMYQDFDDVEEMEEGLKICRYQQPVVVVEAHVDTSPNTRSKKRKKSDSPKNKKHQATDVDFEPEVFTGIYVCKLCGFTSVVRDDFHEHVKEHREAQTSYQCMECGELFVVKSSLMKHLNYMHLIDDAEKYLSDNDCVNECSNQLVIDEDEPVAEGQCKVCRAQFEDEVELKKHARVHGMDFLKKKVLDKNVE